MEGFRLQIGLRSRDGVIEDFLEEDREIITLRVIIEEEMS